MQFDRTRIAIRERKFLDLMDLSLHVLRTFFRPLFFATLTTALPLALLNWFLLHRLINEELEFFLVARYVWVMTMLLFLQAPLMSSVGTIYLGNVLFYEPAGPRAIWNNMKETFPRLLLLQLALRGVLPGVLLVLTIDPMDTFGPVEGFFLPIVCLWAIGLRSFRPFLNEIVLLEKNPLRVKKGGGMSIRKRNSVIHKQSSSDLFGRWIIAMLLGIILTLSIFGAIYGLILIMVGMQGMGYVLWYGGLPLAMWTTAMYFTVVRFMSYLDLRIRREGWEVELLIRTVGKELSEQAKMLAER